VDRVSAGIAMSAPMMKKTAAMTTLDNCMESSSAPVFLDHYLPHHVFCRVPHGRERVTA
jgi:hypothetical protein